MPAITFKPRVKESSTTTGTGNITLAGAVVGYQSFDDAFVVTDDYFYYCIEGVDGSGVPTGQWEEGIGHLSASTTLVRDTLLSSSTGSAVSFSAGTKNVFCTVAAAGVSDYLLRSYTTTVDCSDETNWQNILPAVPTGKKRIIESCYLYNATIDLTGLPYDDTAFGWNGATTFASVGADELDDMSTSSKVLRAFRRAGGVQTWGVATDVLQLRFFGLGAAGNITVQTVYFDIDA